MIGIISYGLGNTMAIKNILNDIDIKSKLITKPDELNKEINKIILPGVGSFDYAMNLLEQNNLINCIKDFTTDKKNKTLGICIGMQILAKTSEEGNSLGLDLIPGKIKRFKNAPILPHVGWNYVKTTKKNNLTKNIYGNSKFYFLHSYFFETDIDKYQLGYSNYFHNFTSIIAYDNIYGVQFHPEKSHSIGRILFENFAEI